MATNQDMPLLSIIRDVTESKQAREALIDSEEFNRRIVESSSARESRREPPWAAPFSSGSHSAISS